jgi:hypothetical protein
MQGYSLLGYINAVMQRSGKTLLVEGPTDSILINRVKHQVLQETQMTPSGVIDGAAMLQDDSDPALCGKGNKAKVLALLNLAANDHRVQKVIAGKLGTLVDREWDGLNVGREFLDPWVPPTQNAPHFQTVGHSMENYFFTCEAFKGWLLQSYPEYVDHGFLSAIESRFVAMIALASAWSMKIRDIQAISKAEGLINRKLLKWNNSAYELDINFGALLSGRNIVVPPNFVSEVNMRTKSYLETFDTYTPGIWLCHGHLGEEMLWSCIANLAEEIQVDQRALQTIERGNSKIRFRCLVDFLAREKLSDATPLREAVEWLCT